MNQGTNSTSNKLNNSKLNDIKLNNTKVNDNKINNSKGNNTKVNDIKINNSKIVNNKSTTSVGYSATNIAGMGLLVIVLIIVLGSSYWLYNYYTKKSFITVLDVDAMPDVKVASSTFNIASNLIPNSTYSNEYSISFWVNILDYKYNYGKEKVILRRGDKSSANPEIILSEKTNDLIVRIKLQTPTGTSVTVASDNFIDIPISTSSSATLNLDNYEETVSEDQLMYDESQSNSNTSLNTNNSLKENFNISSYPAPVKFESDSNNNNASLDIKSDLGENKVDYPTIKYISNNNTNFNEQYFSLISGNDISNISGKSLNSNDMNDYTRGGNHPTNESFDNVTDAKNLIDSIITDISNIMGVLIPPTTPDIEQYVLRSSIYSMIIEFINLMNAIVKTGTTNFDKIIANFKTTMNTTSKDPKFSNYVDKLVTDITGLVKYNNVTYNYASFVNDVNESPIIKLHNVPPINENIFNPTNSLIENLLVLLQQLLVVSLQGTINENAPKGSNIPPTTTVANCVNKNHENLDPTLGTCIVKMIPLQKWVNVTVSVYNQVVDIYIDGLLTSSCVLKRFPAISTTDVSLTPDGGFAGYISRVKFLNSAMTVKKAKDIYYDGPIYSPSLYSQIPTWAYWTLLVIVIASIAYSFFV